MLENYISKKELLNLWRKYNFRPNNRLGQNFLVDFAKIQEIVSALEVSSHDMVYEVGPGFGALTCFLASRAKEVVAIEKDKRLVQILGNVCADYPNVTIIHNDILQFLQREHPQGKFIGNPPYYLTSPLIHQLLEIKPRPLSIVLTLQKEVGEKILSRPPKANRLAIAAQITSRVEKIDLLDRQSFWPMPAVDSLLIKIQPFDEPPLSVETLKFLNKSFSAPRKTLLNNLKSQFPVKREQILEIFSNLGLPAKIRPGALSLEDWKKLIQIFPKGKQRFQRGENPL